MRRGKILSLTALLATAVAACGGSQPTPPAGQNPTSRPEFGANVVRIPGISPMDVAAAAVLATYPPDQGTRPNGWVLTTPTDWQRWLLAAQFAGRPVYGGLLLTNQAFLPLASQDVLSRLRAGGFPRSGGVQTLLLEKFGQDVLLYLTRLKLRPAALTSSDPPALGLKLIPFRGGFAHMFSSDVVIASSEQRDYALPAGAWSAYSGDTVAFVSRNSVPPATQTLLQQRQKLIAAKPAIYIVGPPSVISPGVQAELGAYGTVKRIAGPNPIATAVAFARYRDPTTGFGWGLKRGPASVALLDTRDPANAVGGFDLAAAGPQAPLLLTSGPGPLPPAVKQYLRQLSSPGHSQAFVLGGTASISSATLREVDGLLGSGGA